MPHKASTPPTLLVTGGSGQIGFELARSLACLGKLIVLDRAQCDLRDAGQIRQRVRQYRPDVIINAAAYTAVDAAEHDASEAVAVNAAAPAVLGEEARAQGSLLVHYSTDYVFDGRLSRPYVESDPAHPLSVYGQSKLAGEQGVAASGACALVLRTGWVAGVHGGNFVKAILRLASERSALRVVADQHGAPTTAALVADVTAQIVARHWLHGDRMAFPGGVYHLAASGRTTWHAYATEVLRTARERGARLAAGPEDVLAVTTQDYPALARRPANSLLDTTRLRETFGLHMPDWRDGVHHLLAQLVPVDPTMAAAKGGA